MATLQQIRIERDITQAALASQAGVSCVAISRAETGKPVQKETLVAIARALGISVEEITGVRLHSRVAAAARRSQRRRNV